MNNGDESLQFKNTNHYLAQRYIPMLVKMFIIQK